MHWASFLRFILAVNTDTRLPIIPMQRGLVQDLTLNLLKSELQGYYLP